MIKSFKIKFVLVLLLLTIPLGGVYAAQDDGVFTYVFHLYFNNGNLVEDRDYEVPFELVAQEFDESTSTGVGGLYTLEIMSVSGKKLASSPFSLPAGGRGVLSPLAPYFDNAKTANFYNPQNQKLLTIDLAPSGPVCNEDKQCNNDTGETFLNCSSDCSAATPVIDDPVFVKVGYFLADVFSQPAFIIILVMAIIGIIVWLWLRRKRKMPPPEAPPTIPTQPV